jgi:hypothetical protein
MAPALFTDAEKLAAAEHEIVRRKRMFALAPAEHKTRQIEVMKAIARDYQARIAKGTDGVRGRDEGPGRAVSR